MRTAEELLTTSHALLDIARKYGEAQVSAGSSKSADVSLEKNDYQISKSGDSAQIVLTIYRDKRKGSATTNDLSPAGLRDVAEKAATIAETSIRDEKLAFSMPGEVKHLTLADPKTAELPTEQLFEITQAVFEPLLADPEISVDGAHLNHRHSASALVNTNGVSLSRETTVLNASAMGMGIRGEEVTSFDYDGIALRTVNGFQQAAVEMSNELARNLKSIFHPRKGESYKGMIILRPEVVAQLLLDIVEFHAHGNALKDNASKWKDQLGKAIASPLLTLHDDPFNLAYLGACGYDGAGTPTKPSTLVDKGVLQYYMESVDSASRRDTHPTGHENGINVCLMEGGTGGVMDLARLAGGKPILCMRRFSGNLNSISGDFSGVAKNSHLIMDGEVFPVTETMIAGNAFDLLNNIIAIGESKNYHNQLQVGPVLVDGVTVSVG